MDAVPGREHPAIERVEHAIEPEPRLLVELAQRSDRAVHQDGWGERLIELEAHELLVVQSEQVMQKRRARARRGDDENRGRDRSELERRVQKAVEPTGDRHTATHERVGEGETTCVQALS